MPGPIEKQVAADKSVARLTAVCGGTTLVMLALSWPLWVGLDDFPRVPFIAGLPDLPGPVATIVFGLLVASIACGTMGLVRRSALGLSLLLLALLIVQDQHRFQAWAYQYCMFSLAIVGLPASRALGCGRWFLIALYFHSGLSKLDASFCHEMGLTFLRTAVHPLGWEPLGWPSLLRTGSILAMPAAELLIATGLAVRRTRRVAVWFAAALHLILIAILGPWGIDHSRIVLIWNAALVVEVVLLFGGTDRQETVSSERLSPAARLILVTFSVLLLLPFGERWGWLDSWPAFALYASHAERTELFVVEEEPGILPRSIRRHLRAASPQPWSRLDLTAWSREERGVPVYPQGRACNGLAEGLAARYRGGLSVRVVQWGRADLWTMRRDRAVSVGLTAIREQGKHYRFNAHPSRSGSDPISKP